MGAFCLRLFLHLNTPNWSSMANGTIAQGFINPLGPGSTYGHLHIISLQNLLQVKWIPESHPQLNSRGCKSIMPSLQTPTIEPFNNPYWQAIVTIEPINSQFTTWLGWRVQVVIPFNYHDYLLVKFHWPGQFKRVTLDWYRSKWARAQRVKV